jgi:hypothetical protein
MPADKQPTKPKLTTAQRRELAAAVANGGKVYSNLHSTIAKLVRLGLVANLPVPSTRVMFEGGPSAQLCDQWEFWVTTAGREVLR